MNDNHLIKIPPRKSKSIFLEKNQKIKIINTHGTQVVDTWCFNQADIKEFMSMEHNSCLLYTSPSPRDEQSSRMPSSA